MNQSNSVLIPLTWCSVVRPLQNTSWWPQRAKAFDQITLCVGLSWICCVAADQLKFLLLTYGVSCCHGCVSWASWDYLLSFIGILNAKHLLHCCVHLPLANLSQLVYAEFHPISCLLVLLFFSYFMCFRYKYIPCMIQTVRSGVFLFEFLNNLFSNAFINSCGKQSTGKWLSLMAEWAASCSPLPFWSAGIQVPSCSGTGPCLDMRYKNEEPIYAGQLLHVEFQIFIELMFSSVFLLVL